MKAEWSCRQYDAKLWNCVIALKTDPTMTEARKCECKKLSVCSKFERV